MLGLQGEIAREVAGKLDAVITKNEARQINDLPTVNPEAYDYYLRARYFLHKANDVQRLDVSREG
ncbi:MAG: hypothetical protein U5L72_13520 [Bacteroidales bacterium]|nr:hypothetical protein [Bacteroidales bacterium]